MADDLQAEVRRRIGRRVKQLRLLRGMSQEKLAELVGNQYKHIGQIERGEVNVGINILTLIAAGLSVEIADLVEAAARSRDDQIYTLTQFEVERLQQALQVVERVKRRRTRRRRSG